jgi:hypothetical protein
MNYSDLPELFVAVDELFKDLHNFVITGLWYGVPHRGGLLAKARKITALAEFHHNRGGGRSAGDIQQPNHVIAVSKFL